MPRAGQRIPTPAIRLYGILFDVPHGEFPSHGWQTTICPYAAVCIMALPCFVLSAISASNRRYDRDNKADPGLTPSHTVRLPCPENWVQVNL